MRKFLFFITFFIISNFSFSQIIFEETFENGNMNGLIPSGWYCGDFPKWIAGEGEQDHFRFAHSGNWYAFFPWSSNSWMYKPVDLIENETYEFSMWYKTDGSIGFQYEVKWGTDTFEVDMTNTIQPLTAINNTEYEQIISTFTPTVSGTYYIGIHGISTNNPWYLEVDDIKLQNVEDYNFEITRISEDTIIYAGEYYNYKVKIKNIGIYNDTYDFSYVSDWNVEFYDKTGTVPLNTIDLNSYLTDTFIVRQYVPVSGVELGQNHLTTVTISSQNSIVENDIQIYSIAVSPVINYPYYQGFEGMISYPVGWNTEKISGNYKFEMIFEGQYPTCTPHDFSLSMIFYQSFSASAGSTATLSSPPLSLTDNEYIVRFWVYRTADIDNKEDRLEIYLSDDESLTNEQLLGTVHRATNFSPVETTEGWFEYYYTFTSTESIKYIVFKAISEYGWNMYLDDFFINLNLPDETAPEFLSISETVQYADLPMPVSIVIRDDSQVTSVMQGIYNVGNGDEFFDMNLNTFSKGNFTYNGQIPAQVDSTTGTVRFVMEDTIGNFAETDEFEIIWSGIAPLLEESFEDDFPPLDWIIVDEPLTWFIWSQVSIEFYDDSDENSYIVVPRDGVKQAMVGWDYQENHQDEWLITPEVEITDLADLSFETFAQYGSLWYDNYIVGISTDGITWDEVWNAFYLDNSVNQYDERVVIPLDDYVGQTIRVSWRAYNSQFDNLWYSWFIDDVKIEKRILVNIPEISESDDFYFEILQNPTSDYLNLRFNNLTENNLIVNIYDVNGQLRKTEKIDIEKTAQTVESLEVSYLPSGIYLCSVENGERKITKRIVIFR
jgi:hypothetical protein